MERFQQRTRDEQAEITSPAEFEPDSYHVPGRDTGLPSWLSTDLDPQRLDGRSVPAAGSRPRQPETGHSLADFLMRRTETAPEVPRGGSGRAFVARLVHPDVDLPEPAAEVREEPAGVPDAEVRTAPAGAQPASAGLAATAGVRAAEFRTAPTGTTPAATTDAPTAEARIAPAAPTNAASTAPTAEIRTAPASTASAATSAVRAAEIRTAPAGVPAAEDPRIFLLHRMLPPDILDKSGMDVETRPHRSYPVCWPGSSRETRIRPEYHGVGVLQAATHAHGRLQTRGLGLMFPPHTVHARNSTSVVIGNNCELTQVDHVHIRQAVVAQDDALRSDRVKEIIARARPGQDNSRVVHDLRRALDELVERPPAAGPTTTSRPLRADCVTSIHRAESVQLGDHALTRLDSEFVVERTTVPAGALLADSEDLAARYVALVADPADDPGAQADFLGDLVGAAANATDENLLGYADGLPEQRAGVLGLFGMVSVNQATSVMIGVGNQLHPELDLDSARFRPDRDITGDLARHRANRPPDPDREERSG